MLTIVLDGHHEFVEVSMSYHERGAPGDDVQAVISASRVMAEMGARTLLARVVGHRLEQGGTRSYGGCQVSMFGCRLSGRAFVDLATWASARGWTVSNPASLPSVTLSKEGREVLLPLASVQARVDGEWRDLGDCVAEKDGRWLVPASLDAIVR
ncbi:MAG: stalk domain-containing protein [Fimbriimonadaceae bacterium]